MLCCVFTSICVVYLAVFVFMLCCVAYCLLYVYMYKLYNLWLWTFFFCYIGHWGSSVMKRVDLLLVTGHWSDERVLSEYYGYGVKREKERSCKELDLKSFLFGEENKDDNK